MTTPTDNLRPTVTRTIDDSLTQLWENASELTRVALDAYTAGLNALVDQQTAVQRASDQWLSGIFTARFAGRHEVDTAAHPVDDKVSARTTSGPRRTPTGAAKRSAKATVPRRRVTPAAKAAFADAVGPALSRWTREGYDTLTAAEIVERLPHFSQLELVEVEAYEKAHDVRQTILQRIDALRGQEPMAGYDELTVPDVESHLVAGDNDHAARVRDYERLHKGREGVLGAVRAKLS
jgi:hypothetical protein